MNLGRFFGGLVLPGLKPAPEASRIRVLPLPDVLRVPLLQHAGLEAECCVRVGQRVARFELLASAPTQGLGAPVHSPAAGEVIGIERGAVALSGTPDAWHVLIRVDANGPSQPMPALDWRQTATNALLERIRSAGVVGMGGAGFPAIHKLSRAVPLLLINAAECEPVVAADEALIREHAHEVLEAAAMLASMLSASRVVVALEQRMAPALDALRSALREQSSPPDVALEIVALPDRYPTGGERQLIQCVTGQELPEGALPADIGITVHNVATAVAALRAVRDGVPLVSRIVTVGGDGAHGSGNFEVAVGTPAQHLGAAVGGWQADATALLAGGPMMGVPLPDDSIAVGKSVIALTAWRSTKSQEALPCIRCGDCATACPSHLQPQLLHAALEAQQSTTAVSLGLMACIECGCCDMVCPSRIPLTAQFHEGRSKERERRFEREVADAARTRFEQREARLQREAAEANDAQATRLKRNASAAAAALAKARAKRDGAPPA